MYLAHPGRPARSGPFHPDLPDLPESIPLFPVSGAVVLPNCDLPLNVFEPRYLAMSRFALGTRQRMVGMVQPVFGLGDGPGPDQSNSDSGKKQNGDGNANGSEGGAESFPHLRDLQRVGCAGRIVSFAETADGRYIVVLRGVCRFRLEAEPEPDAAGGFVRARPQWRAYALDLQPPGDSPSDMAGLRDLTVAYLASREMKPGDAFADGMTAEEFVNNMAMLCPFSGAEKQALLEAENVVKRAEALRAIMGMAVRGGGADGDGVSH